ncbi:IMP dehydrogenase [Candidatus Gottesmanbacteria bacterium]|nr:IMP dehydrogenase [Candidatus Gottesmanbacteria bacterium]
MNENKIVQKPGLTFDDVLVLPNFAQVKRQDIDVKTHLTQKISLSIPIVSSPMDTVTTALLAISLAKLGGIGFLHRNLTIEQQVEEIKIVKEGNHLVGAAVGVGKDLEERVSKLAGVNVDALIVDSAHGFSKWVIDAVTFIAQKYPQIELIGGNIATKEGAEALIKAGANALRVGMGPGSICTTRVISGMGVPQITAIMEVYSVAKEHNIPIIADGGIRSSGDIVKALAAGADCVMLGSLLAGSNEAPGEKVTIEGKEYKRYRGMGSVAAMVEGGAARYGQEYIKGKEKKLVAEGIEGLVPYKGSLEDVIGQLVGGLRTGMYYAGVKNIKELKEKTRFLKITQASLIESYPHTITIRK